MTGKYFCHIYLIVGMLLSTACQPRAISNPPVETPNQPNLITTFVPSSIPTLISTQIPAPSLIFDPYLFLKKSDLVLHPLPDLAGYLRSKQGMPVLLLPLQQEKVTGAYQANLDRPITLLSLPAEFLLGGGDQFVLQSPAVEGQLLVQEVQLAVLPILVSGEPMLGLAVLSSGLRNLMDQQFQLGQSYTVPAEEDVAAVATYIGGRDSIYPNKIINLLIASAYLAEYQLEKGPFKAYDGYAYNHLIRLRGRDTLHYEMGLDKVPAAGVCAAASLTSAVLYDLSRTLDVDYKGTPSALIRTQYPHLIAAPYSGSPFLPVDIDTAVALGEVNSADLVWQMPAAPEALYLEITSALLLNDLSFEETNSDGIGGLADAELLLSMAFTQENPINQSGKIQAQLSDYRRYRESQHEDVPASLFSAQAVQVVQWDEGIWLELLQTVLPQSD
jgi:hypothetical protein